MEAPSLSQHHPRFKPIFTGTHMCSESSRERRGPHRRKARCVSPQKCWLGSREAAVGNATGARAKEIAVEFYDEALARLRIISMATRRPSALARLQAGQASERNQSPAEQALKAELAAAAAREAELKAKLKALTAGEGASRGAGTGPCSAGAGSSRDVVPGMRNVRDLLPPAATRKVSTSPRTPKQQSQPPPPSQPQRQPPPQRPLSARQPPPTVSSGAPVAWTAKSRMALQRDLKPKSCAELVEVAELVGATEILANRLIRQDKQVRPYVGLHVSREGSESRDTPPRDSDLL